MTAVNGVNYDTVVLDGSQYFSSETMHCPYCLQRQDKNGDLHYSHSVVAATLVRAGSPDILPLAAEEVRNTEGREKQDCEINAGKRLIQRQNVVAARAHQRRRDDTVRIMDVAIFIFAPQAGRTLDFLRTERLAAIPRHRVIVHALDRRHEARRPTGLAHAFKDLWQHAPQRFRRRRRIQ